jgi:hypothetical protein
MAPRPIDLTQLIRNGALVVVAKAARNGGIVRSVHEAAKIARKYPDSGMTPDEISREIFRLAVECRLAVDPSP